MLTLLQEQGCDEETAEAIARVLLGRGMTIVAHADPTLAADPRAVGEDTFLAIADLLGGTN
jgi:hypothetical protein